MNNNFCKNYDTREISNLKKTSVIFLKKIITSIIDKKINKGNQIFIKLIYNYFKQKKPIFTMISGPFSLSYHTSILYNKRIYIFGEYHGTENPCKQYDKNGIHLYLRQLFTNTDVFIDFYLETQLNTIGENRYKNFTPISINYINKINNEILYMNREKIDNLIRYHSIDPRFEKYYIKTNLSIIEKIMIRISNFSYKNKIKSIDFIIKTHKKKLDNIIGIIENEGVHFFIKSIFGVKIIKKEIEKSIIEEEITSFFMLKIQNIYIDYKVIETLISFKNNNYKVSNEEYEKILLIFLSMNALIVDLYTISIIFKTFKINKNNRPTEIQNIIIYTGDSHSIVYRQFLNYIKFLSVQEIVADKTTSVRCLYMNLFQQPFFSV